MPSKRGASIRSKISHTSASLTRQASVDSVKALKEVKIKPNILAHDEYGQGRGNNKYDCILFLAYCPQHDQVLLNCQQQADTSTLIFLPYMEMLPNETWSSTARYGFCQLLADNDSAKFNSLTNGKVFEQSCLQMLRLQLPATSKFVTRVTVYFELKKFNVAGQNSQNSFNCCQPVDPFLKWFPLKEIIEEKLKFSDGQIAGFWGPEVVEFCKQIKSGNTSMRIHEFNLEEITQLTPRESPRNAEEELLLGLRLSSADVERMYIDYVGFCNPSFYLTPSSFVHYLKKLGFEHVNRSTQLFNAFNVTGSGRLSFKEFLIGMALYDQAATNGPPRAKFVFCFYNVDKSGVLSPGQLKALLNDLSPAFREENKVKAIINGLGPEPLSVKAFIKAVELGKIPDISTLCRSSKATFQNITRSIAIKNLEPNRESLASKNIGNIIIKRHRNVCPTCKSIKYELASHAVTMKTNGEVVSRVLSVVKTDVAITEGNKDKLMLTPQQFSSEFVFNPTSVGNVLMKLIREFSHVKGTAWQPRGLMDNRPAELWTLLLTLFREMEILLEVESKCQKVYSPCYVIGDIHGNLEDLLTLEATIWPQVPFLGASYLFLGDYVDRGRWSLETAIYLMAFKVLCPNKVTTLRGNHEVRQLQINYSYKSELLRKYGDKYGIRIWELTNRLFDKMPVCAVLDDAIYCAHGGIPKSAATIEQINRLPREICDPQSEAPIVWEILWSDPANRDDFNDTCAARNVDPEKTNGYVFNIKRGTAFRFNEQAATTFLNTNLLTKIIRAHEVIPLGYFFHFGSVCATIFSSSHYCGNDNDCCVILADNQRLMVLHIDTADNSTATN